MEQCGSGGVAATCRCPAPTRSRQTPRPERSSPPTVNTGAGPPADLRATRVLAPFLDTARPPEAPAHLRSRAPTALTSTTRKERCRPRERAGPPPERGRASQLPARLSTRLTTARADSTGVLRASPRRVVHRSSTRPALARQRRRLATVNRCTCSGAHAHSHQPWPILAARLPTFGVFMISRPPGARSFATSDKMPSRSWMCSTTW
jgi:hypothetical protein